MHVEDAIAEAGVKCYEKTDGCHEKLYRPEKELLRQLFDANIPLFELGVERPISCLMAKATRFIDEKFWWVAFVNEDNVDDEDDCLKNSGKVLGPSPA